MEVQEISLFWTSLLALAIVFLIIAILTGLISLWFWIAFSWWPVTLIIFCNYLLTICISSFEKYLFRDFSHFIIGFFAFLLLSWISYNFILTHTSQRYGFQVFSPILLIISYSVDFFCAEPFQFDVARFVHFWFTVYVLGIMSKFVAQVSLNILPLFSSSSFAVLGHTLVFNPFWVYFVHRVMWVLLYSFACRYSIFQILFIGEKCFFPIVCPSHLNWWWSQCMDLFLGSLVWFISLYACFYTCKMLFWLLYLGVVYFEII